MNILLKIRNAMKGAKTYLVGASGICLALVAYGDGSMDIIEAGKAIIAVVMGLTIRAGIAKTADQ